jgi:hypothetical protein
MTDTRSPDIQDADDTFARNRHWLTGYRGRSDDTEAVERMVGFLPNATNSSFCYRDVMFWSGFHRIQAVRGRQGESGAEEFETQICHTDVIFETKNGQISVFRRKAPHVVLLLTRPGRPNMMT